MRDGFTIILSCDIGLQEHLNKAIRPRGMVIRQKMYKKSKAKHEEGLQIGKRRSIWCGIGGFLCKPACMAITGIIFLSCSRCETHVYWDADRSSDRQLMRSDYAGVLKREHGRKDYETYLSIGPSVTPTIPGPRRAAHCSKFIVAPTQGIRRSRSSRLATQDQIFMVIIGWPLWCCQA